jgi:two-component system sensor histidine kinase AlgZ
MPKSSDRQTKPIPTNGQLNYRASLADPKELIPDLCQGRSVLWVILFSEALVIVLTLLSSGALDFSWEQFGMLSLYVQWMVLMCAAALCRLRLHLPVMNINAVTGSAFTVIVTVNLGLCLLTQWALNYFLLENLGWDWLLRNLLISSILAALVLHYFYVQMESRLRARSELQSRVQALHSRIRPHFLFNSMNIIASLIHVDPDKAEQAVEDLSELFRASLKEAGSEVSLKQELELCKKYVNIEQLRLEDRLHLDWNIDAPEQTRIPLLTLQPLIENAIYHGIAPSSNGGTVTVTVKHKNKRVFIQVNNPVAPARHNNRKEQGNHMALENIRHRLHALYGENVTMAAEQQAQQFTITIEYSYSDSQHDN